MILHCYQSFVADAYGNIQPQATVEVRNAITGSLATLYKDSRGTLPITNLKADNYGFFRFYAETGRYNIKTTSLGLDTSFIDVDIIGVAKQQIDVAENGSGDFTTIQEAFNYISRAIPSHDSNEKFQFNIYGDVGAVNTNARAPVILNCVEDAVVGDMTLLGSTVHIVGALQAGVITSTNSIFTSNTGSSLDCTSITNKGGRIELSGTLATSESQATNNGLHNIICDGGEIYLNATVSAKSQNKNFLAHCKSGKITITGNIDIQANIRGAFSSDGGDIVFTGQFLSGFSVFYSAIHAKKGTIQATLSSTVTATLIAGNTGLGGVSSESGGRVIVDGSVITCNGFTNAAYAANGGVVYAALNKIAQGSSSTLANITTNAYNTSGSAIFLGVA